MIFSTAVFALILSQTPAWTWTLYEGVGPVVLANERPDTPDLRSTLECARASGIVTLSLYGSPFVPGVVTISSGEASAVAEMGSDATGAVTASLRTDHPVFAQFAANGALSVVSGGARQSLEIPTPDLVKLRRLADLCSG